MPKAALNLKLLGICFIGLCTLAAAQRKAEPGETPANPRLGSILERMQAAQSAPRPSVPYEVVREYRLLGGKNSSEPSSVVTAEIDYLPPNGSSYVIQRRIGGGRGDDVVRRILQHEIAMSSRKQLSEVAVDTTNYFFSYLGMSTFNGSSCYLLGLAPKRKETGLIHGTAWVDAHSFLIRRVEGEMVKNPSWILKKVDLTIDFADIAGVWLQTGMQAVADVRFLGTQVLESRTIDTHVGSLVAQKMINNEDERIRNSELKRASIPFWPATLPTVSGERK